MDRRRLYWTSVGLATPRSLGNTGETMATRQSWDGTLRWDDSYAIRCKTVREHLDGLIFGAGDEQLAVGAEAHAVETAAREKKPPCMRRNRRA